MCGQSQGEMKNPDDKERCSEAERLYLMKADHFCSNLVLECVEAENMSKFSLNSSDFRPFIVADMIGGEDVIQCCRIVLRAVSNVRSIQSLVLRGSRL